MREGRELLEKRRGTNASLYLAKGRLADDVGSDSGHEAAKPEGVIHSTVLTMHRREQ